MALDDYELNLQTEIVRWKCSRYAECNMIFIRKPRHIKLGMKGLLWSVQTLALQNPSEYSFTIRGVKRSEAAAHDCLPTKFEILLGRYKASMESVHRVEEALDKLYAFSSLFALAKRNRRWQIVVDAEITATACESAKAAVNEAAQAAAALLVEQVKNRSLSYKGGEQQSCARSGWWIDDWTVEDELWAASFFPQDSFKCMMRQFQAKAVQNGNVLQWCTVKVFDEPNPNFQFEIDVPQVLDGDDVLLRIGVANDRPLMVRVFLTESLKVDCSQKGIQTVTSLGLRYLLPEVVRDFINSALNKGDVSNRNVVKGLLGELIRYLAFLGNKCLICGFDRLSDVPRSSTCSNICKARKQPYENAIARFLSDLDISEEKRRTRREEYIKKLFNNSREGRSSLGKLLSKVVMDEATYHKRTDDDSIFYQKAVGRVAKMKSSSIKLALQIPQSGLWIDDDLVMGVSYKLL